MNIIFFAPYNINEKQDLQLNSAPRIRCYNIYKQMKLTNSVFLISGDSIERKRKYQEVEKLNLLKNVDGLYMENPNCSIKNFDIRFLKKVKKHGIVMSMFYRDIHWQFPEFFSSFKHKIFYYRKSRKFRKQLHFFKEIFDIIYSPTQEFAEFAGLDSKHLLPPAGNVMEIKKTDNLGFLFAGSQKTGFNNILEANKILLAEGEEYPLYLVTNKPKSPIAQNISISPVITEDIIQNVGVGIIPLTPTKYYKLSISLKFMQYMSYGLPIICQNLPSFNYYHSKYNVCVFFNGTAQDLAEKMKYIMRNHEIRKNMSANAFNSVKYEENWQKRVEKIILDINNIRKHKNENF